MGLRVSRFGEKVSPLTFEWGMWLQKLGVVAVAIHWIHRQSTETWKFRCVWEVVYGCWVAKHSQPFSLLSPESEGLDPWDCFPDCLTSRVLETVWFCQWGAFDWVWKAEGRWELSFLRPQWWQLTQRLLWAWGPAAQRWELRAAVKAAGVCRHLRGPPCDGKSPSSRGPPPTLLVLPTVM